MSLSVLRLYSLYKLNLGHIDCINNGCSIHDVTHWFEDCGFEALSLHLGRRRLVFLEPEVTIFGREGGIYLFAKLAANVSDS